MQYAIEMYFDKETENKIMALVNKISEAGISHKFLDWKTRPHITLACFNDVNEAECCRVLKTFAGAHKKIPAYLDSVGMFVDTKTIFLSPTMNREMFDLQSELHKYMQDFDTAGWEWYIPDNWVPHCTISLNQDDAATAFLEASNLVLQEFEKLAGVYESVGLVKISFPVQEIETYKFD